MANDRAKRNKDTRKQLLRPVQLIVFALICSLFAGGVTLFGMGFAQDERVPGQTERALVVALIVFGITFIVVLLVMALLLLAVDPKQIEKPVDRGVLMDAATPSSATAATDNASDNAPADTGSATAIVDAPAAPPSEKAADASSSPVPADSTAPDAPAQPITKPPVSE